MDIDKNKVCDLVKKFCLELKLSDRATSYALGYIQLIDPKNHKHSKIIWAEYEEIAASAVYIGSILCGDRKTQQDIKNISGVPIHRIRKIYTEMASCLPVEEIL